MRDHSELRQRAESLPSVTVDSAVLLELLDEVDRLRGTPIVLTERRQKRRHTKEDDVCARWIFSLIQKANESARPPNWLVWSDDVRKMRELDGRTHKEICELFRWAHNDDFWCANILSPQKLRAKWDQLTMKRSRTGGAGQMLGKAGRATARAAEEWLGGAS
jgi:hypothetical protein